MFVFASTETQHSDEGIGLLRGHFSFLLLLTSFIPPHAVHTLAGRFSIYSIWNENKWLRLKLTLLCRLLYIWPLLYCSFLTLPFFLPLPPPYPPPPPLHLNAFGSVVLPPYCANVFFLTAHCHLSLLFLLVPSLYFTTIYFFLSFCARSVFRTYARRCKWS